MRFRGRKLEEKKRQLRIGDQWNAITIIALSQNNPLKAIAEFVENSIDAQARNIIIIRGKTKGANYLKIVDDGQGIPLNDEGVPNFQYVATHICDSIKKKLKEEGVIDLLSRNQNDKSPDSVGNADRRFVISKEKVNNRLGSMIMDSPPVGKKLFLRISAWLSFRYFMRK